MNDCVETLNRWGESISALAWPMLWQSSLLIAVIFAFDLMFARRIRASVRYAFWTVLLVKLLLPPALALPTGATWWLWRPHPVVETPTIRNYTVSYGNSVPEALPSASVSVVESPPKFSGDAWVLLAMAIVGVGLLSWLAFRWVRVAAKVRRAATAPAELDGILEEARQLAGLRWPLRLKLIDDRQSPAVCGLFHPVILLPRTLANQLAGRQLRAVLLHEAMHLRRGDIWVNFAQTLLQIAYWWHPLLWLANARIRRVREEAVDDAVMHALRDGADAYAPTLLEVAKFAFRRPLASLGLIGILESRSALRQRVERLVDFQPSRRTGLTLLSLCGIVAFSAVALPMGQGPEKDASSTQSSSPEASSSVITNGVPADITVIRETVSTGDTNDFVMRSFKVGTNDFITNLGAITGSPLSASDTNVSTILKQYFEKAGLDMSPPKTVYFNTRLSGVLFVYATPQDLDLIEHIVQTLHAPSGWESDWLKSLNNGTAKIHTSARLDAIYHQMNRIHLSEVSFQNLPLSEVLRELREETFRRDPHRQGINFLFNPHIAPAPGVPVKADAADDAADPTRINISLNLKNVTLKDVLNAVCLNSDQPIKYSVEEFGIVFSVKGANTPQFEVRTFTIDPNTFYFHLQQEMGPSRSGSVNIQKASGGKAIAYGSDPNLPQAISALAKGYFERWGVNLNPPKTVFLNDKLGALLVYATPHELDVIQKAMQELSADPPQIHIKARFMEVPKEFFLSAAANSLSPGMTNGTILTAAESKKVLRLLESQKGEIELAEPEAITLSGRQCQMRATSLMWITNSSDGPGSVPETKPVETGPVLDVVPDLLADGRNTINLTTIASRIEFLGYSTSRGLVPNVTTNSARRGFSPVFSASEASLNKDIWDGQTLVLFPKYEVLSDGKAKDRISKAIEEENRDKVEIVLVTATVVDAAGNRMHSDYYDSPYAPKGPGGRELP